MKLKNTAPYLILAFINWLEDSGGEPRILLKNSDNTMFPPEYSNQNAVLFNISEQAIQKFSLDENGISFSARFSGREFNVYAPLDYIMELHSKDGTVVIPFNQGKQLKVPDVNSVGPVVQEIKEKLKLSLIQCGSEGDGIPSGKLSVV